jgi:membrane protein DedA with SNARE-associated domain
VIDAFLDWVLALPPGPTYGVLALLAALENVLPPVPADVALALGAFLAGRGEVAAWPLGLLCWTTNQASAAAVYFLARKKGPSFVSHGLGRRLLPPKAMAALRPAGERYGIVAIFVSRFLPGLRAAVLPFAGVVGVPPLRALVPAGAASAIWYAFLVGAGMSLGKNLDAVRRAVEDANRLLSLVALVVTVFFAAWLWQRTRRRRARS